MRIYSGKFNRNQLPEVFKQREEQYNAKLSAYRNARAQYESDVKQHDSDFEEFIKSKFSHCFEILPGLQVWVNCKSHRETIIQFSYKSNKISHTVQYSGYRDETYIFKWSVEIILVDNEFKTTSREDAWTNIDIFSIEDMGILSNTIAVLKEISEFDWENALREYQGAYPDYSELQRLDAELDKSRHPSNDVDIIESAVDRFIGKDVFINNGSYWTFYKILSKVNDIYKIAIWEPGYHSYGDSPNKLRELETNDFNNTKSVSLESLSHIISYPFDSYTQEELISCMKLEDKNAIKQAFNGFYRH